MNQRTVPFTVIIPSYRRQESLLHVLSDLCLQTVKPEKVIIVDASPSEMRLTESKIILDVPLTYIPFEYAPNASRQRNIALHKVETPWVLFLDDDVRFSNCLIEKYCEVLTTENIDGVNGLVKLPHYEKYYHVKQSKARIYQCGGVNYQGANVIVESHIICTANFLARTEAVLNAGGFDEQLTGTIDDVDLGIRLKLKGYKVFHHPEPELLHLQLRESGARTFNKVWSLTNLFYFRYRHFDDPGKMDLLVDTLWNLCHPSRDWVYPKVIIERVKDIMQSNKMAIKKIIEGPKFIEASFVHNQSH